MGYASYADSIRDVQCSLEHVASFSSNPAGLDTSAALAVIASAERLLRQLRATLEVATDPSLEAASEVVRLRARLIELGRQRLIDQERITGQLRAVDVRTRETIFWRDKYIELSRRTWKPRRRRPTRRRR
jgi:hypothetical protein